MIRATMAVIRGLAEAKESWAGPAEAKESWAGPAEAKESWAGPAEAKESWAGPTLWGARVALTLGGARVALTLGGARVALTLGGARVALTLGGWNQQGRSGELDGTSRGTGVLDGTSRGSGELDETSRGSGELDGTSRGSGELDGTSRGTGELDVTSRGSQGGVGEEPALAGIGKERPQGGAGQEPALARSGHKGALARSGLWGWAPTHPLICHQQAQGHMSIGRWACGGWRAYISCERQLISRPTRAGRAANSVEGPPRTADQDERRRRSSILFGPFICHGRVTGKMRETRGKVNNGILIIEHRIHNYIDE